MSECVEACLDDHIELFNQYSDNLIEHAKSLEARIEALEKLLDPETLARKIGDWDFTHNDDYFCFKFGGDGDNGEMLIEALAALLEAEK